MKELSPLTAALELTLTKLKQETRGHSLIVGLVGPQGAGKSTACAELVKRGTVDLSLSLDDFYLPDAVREHKRGPPGTHDSQRLAKVIKELCNQNTTSCKVPRFRKDFLNFVEETIQLPEKHPILIVLEGWMVGFPVGPTYEHVWSQLDKLIILDIVKWNESWIKLPPNEDVTFVNRFRPYWKYYQELAKDHNCNTIVLRLSDYNLL